MLLRKIYRLCNKLFAVTPTENELLTRTHSHTLGSRQ